jgi:glucokinase
MLFLAGDIGGTKALLQLIYTPPVPYTDLASSASSSKSVPHQSIQLAQQSYACADFDSLESIIKAFLTQALSADNLSSFETPVSDLIDCDSVKIQSACFGLPGPVNSRVVQLTNLPWVIEAQKIEQACSIQTVHFVNDFYAAASGVTSLTAKDVISLYRPKALASGPGNRLVIGAGSGLGVAPVFYDGKNYVPVSSEGGHFDFAPISQTQQLLLSWLWQEWPHVSYERVLSGPGLEALYRFFKTFDCPTSYTLENSTGSLPVKKSILSDTQMSLISALISDTLKTSLVSLEKDSLSVAPCNELSAAQISAAASQGDPVAIKALTEFVTIYGAFVGASALIWHAPQGIYLAGGIAAKILPWMQEPYFKQAFLEKGRMSKVVANMPIFLVIDECLGLKGAMLQNHLLATV